MLAKTIMVQGTASYVGKSVIAAALCRIFRQDGYRVAPFKAQNMALNSFVTREGGEMGRSQVFQAKAARVEPSVDMNPILLKPTSELGAQVIVRGQSRGNMTATEYHRHRPELMGVVRQALERLRADFEVIVIEGAGSPAEVNLRDRDIVNMPVAQMAQAPVLLVANIDVGGVFAQIVGTLELLEDWERRLVRGLVINKFRGDLSLFRSGVEFLEERTGVPVLGVVPYFTDIPIEEEDSLAPERAVRHGQQARADEVDVAVVFLPHISNFTDFDALEAEPDVLVRYVRRAEELDGADCVILPGSKSTIADLQVIRRAGIADHLQRMARQGTPVVGLCGGYQMLGRKVYDPQHTESDTDETDGLGLLDVETTFEPTKVTTQTTARLLGRGPFFDPLQGREVEGYEIHMGRTTEGRPSALEIIRRQGQPAGEPDGAVSESGLVFGCYLHGLFDSSGFRRHFLNVLRQRKGLAPLTTAPDERPDPLDELAHRVRQSLNMPLLYQIVGLD